MRARNRQTKVLAAQTSRYLRLPDAAIAKHEQLDFVCWRAAMRFNVVEPVAEGIKAIWAQQFAWHFGQFVDSQSTQTRPE